MTLDEAIKHCEEVADTCENKECGKEHKQLAEWLKELKAYRDNRQWIPVSERLPEKDVDVLGYIKGLSFDYQSIMWIDDYTGEWSGFVGSGYRDEVLAWMPLPEKYKNEEGNE